MTSVTIEQYIEVIHSLENEKGVAHTTDIAAELNIKPPSVTEMLHKLHEMDLIIYEQYHGAKLSNSGKIMAQELMIKHKTLADFFMIIGVDEETADSDACQIEHHVSSKTLKQLNQFIRFVKDGPCDPLWLEHFDYFDKTGDRKNCIYQQK
ncbi:MAG: metal-dependent transcriptional regulator [Euryarchaeota archaeon]|nr:metal-dependent transcriptional regulator [Euryarchaeota archaeon]